MTSNFPAFEVNYILVYNRLRSAIVTLQIIYDVIDVHHDANKPSAS